MSATAAVAGPAEAYAAPEPLLRVRDLAVSFGTRAGLVPVVRSVSFEVPRGATVALVGESGCGKSVTALSLTRLLGAAAVVQAGEVWLAGRDVLRCNERELTGIRGRAIAYVFQEPAAALNPVFRVGSQIAETVRRHRPELDERAETLRLLDLVGLPDPLRAQRSYPHELSGGMQQRAMIAIALAGRPQLLVADEPTTALDVTVQAQILELLRTLQARTAMAVLLITHNLAVVAGNAHWIHVMYCGQIVESGAPAAVLRAPRHPYTRALFVAVPRLGRARDRVQGIPGSVPAPDRVPPGCAFAPRCALAQAECHRSMPDSETVALNHYVRCRCWK
jgi:oligopeptide/dipeptide ABC transporter ATP-binding protein